MTYFGYDDLMNVTTKRVYDTRNGTAAELNTGYTYDATTNVLTGISYPAGNTLSLSYDTGWKSSYVLKDSRVLEGSRKIVNVFDYDLQGRTISVTSKIVEGSPPNETDYTDDAAPIVITSYVYDGLGRVKSKSITTGGVSTVQYWRDYNDTNLTVTTTDAKGYRTVVSYDTFFRKTAQENFRPNTETQGVTYDGTGQVSVAKTLWSYDPLYRDKILTETVYASADGSSWYRTKNAYDALGRLTDIYRWNQGAYSLVTNYSYNDSTNTVTEKQYRNASVYTQSVTTKDWLDRVTSVTQYKDVGGAGTASTTSTTYNNASLPVSKTLANGEVYQYTYSRAGLLESIVYPQSRGTESYTYDSNGRLTSKTDVGGNATSYTYNAADLETYRISSATGKDPVAVSTSYTQHGPKTVIQSRGGSEEIRVNYACTYTVGALTTRETRLISSLGGTSTVSHGYDVAGNLKTLTVTGFDGSFTKTLDYSLPFFGGDGGTTDRWMKVSAAGATLGKVSTHYSGPKNVVQYGNLVTDMVYRNYDDFMRPAQMDYTGTAYDQNYTYDWQGNIASWNGSSFSYDGMDRLATSGYNYDIIGNLTAAPGASFTYLPAGTQPSMRLDYKVMNGVRSEYTDDGNLANMVSVEAKYSNLLYDATNRLISLNDVERGVADTYRYGPDGLRFMKVEPAPNGVAKKTYFLYEGNDILYEEGYDNSTKTFSKLNVFLSGLNIGRIKKEGVTESIQFFFTDHLGSRRAVLDSTGAVQAKIDYNVWGVPTVTNYNGYDGSLDISYTGKEVDATKLYYFNARYYDRSMGRFITEDPAQIGINWFVYCENNPVSKIDETGFDVGSPGMDATVHYNEIIESGDPIPGYEDPFLDGSLSNVSLEVVKNYTLYYIAESLRGRYGIAGAIIGACFSLQGDSLISNASIIRELLSNLKLGNSPKTTRVVSSLAELERLFKIITRGGMEVSTGDSKRRMFFLRDGTKVHFRTFSSQPSGGEATIDITFPDGSTKKVHIERNTK